MIARFVIEVNRKSANMGWEAKRENIKNQDQAPCYKAERCFAVQKIGSAPENAESDQAV